MTARAYVFTLNNPTTKLTFNDDVKYAIWQQETGENGTTHYQGYIELKTPRRIAWMQKLIPRAHFETRKGSREQARDYCKKEETRTAGPWEHGTFEQERGKRNDLLRLQEMLKSGESERDIRDKEFCIWARNYKVIERFGILESGIKRNFKTTVYMLIGPPGCGKSKWCLEQSASAYWKQNSKWWCGYDGKSDVVIDDYYGWLPWSTLLNICDRYPCTVETKGGQVNFAAKNIYITSNTEYRLWYKNERIDIAALTRRIDFFVTINPMGTHVTPNI